MNLRIVLVDLDKSVVEAWRTICGDMQVIEIKHASIFEADCDALVSPANSFGFMDGGLDLRISQFFGWHVQDRVQQAIKTKHHGELLVGTAAIVPTDHPKIPYVISAPTMRVPMILGLSTVNVYLATRAVLLLIKHGTLDNGHPVQAAVKTVAIPGMGTGVGRVPPIICARQMRQAIEEVVFDQYTFPQSWFEVQTRHQRLYADDSRDLLYPDE